MAFDDTTTAGGGLMPRATIHELIAHKDSALLRLGQVWDDLEAAGRLAGAASPSGVSGFPFLAGGSPYGRDCKTFKDRAEFDAYASRVMEQAVWRHVIAATKLDTLMDRQEREAFRSALENDPPAATVENIAATIERLIGDSDMIFKRGIANVFAKLDRRFRSHDGFKIGARIVLENALSDFGTWNHYRNHDDSLVDVERAFFQLDGKPAPESRHGGILGLIDSQRRLGSKRSAFEAESDYFRAKVFGNGNIHLWFKRSDLVQRVNQLLADYYGAALGAAPDVADRRHAPSGAVARNMGWFPTPAAVAARVVSEASVYTPESYSGTYPRLRVLEPSAGLGAIAGPCVKAGHDVVCVELHPARAVELRANLRGGQVVQGDFLTLTPHELGLFDRVVMNPPFDRGLDVEHVTHALQFLKPGGTLCAVMAAGVEFREDRRTADFRAMVERFGGSFRDLPPGAFAESGTNVNTLLCTIRKRA
jgi:predicted RNA methylase